MQQAQGEVELGILSPPKAPVLRGLAWRECPEQRTRTVLQASLESVSRSGKARWELDCFAFDERSNGEQQAECALAPSSTAAVHPRMATYFQTTH